MDYEKLILEKDPPIEFLGGMFMEAVTPSEKRIEEAFWVDKQLDKSELPYGIISGIDMAADITETLKQNKTLPRFRGFRNILNWDPALGDKQWPDTEVVTNRFLDDKVKANFKALEEADVTYELHLNPLQYQSAADVLDTVPNLRVIINHRGTPNNIDQNKSEEYWNGMKRFAAMPNVYMKISFFARTDPKWEDPDYMLQASIDLVKLFTPKKCMFATNFPVDIEP